jgi:hypothetical protein
MEFSSRPVLLRFAPAFKVEEKADAEEMFAVLVMLIRHRLSPL